MTRSGDAGDPASRPLLTRNLPGTGGRPRELEDFQVQEIPAYLPCGEGEHCMALVRKRGLTTVEAVRRICRALGLEQRAAGFAGLKDKRGVTTQWISFAGARPQQLLGFSDAALQVLQADLHRNKLRTGHLRGNRFQVTLRGTVADAEARARAVLSGLAGSGLPNYFGPQRFGRRGDNAVRGLQIVRGASPLPRDRQQRRLLVSAAQSLLFNQALAWRVERGTLQTLLGGEVLQKADSGALFVSEDTATDGPRLQRGEVRITGPICGPRMPRPRPDSPARLQEDALLDDHGVTLQDFGRLGRLARGGRRPLTVPLTEVAVEPLDGDLRLSFALPPGAYATVLLAEITKGETTPARNP
jgi:tRNA pseudouridine13 synthase